MHPLVPGRRIGDPLLGRVAEDQLDLRARVEHQVLPVVPSSRVRDGRDLFDESAELRLGLDRRLDPGLELGDVVKRDHEQTLRRLEPPELHLDRDLGAVGAAAQDLTRSMLLEPVQAARYQGLEAAPLECLPGEASQLEHGAVREFDAPVDAHDEKTRRRRLEEGMLVLGGTPHANDVGSRRARSERDTLTIAVADGLHS